MSAVGSDYHPSNEGTPLRHHNQMKTLSLFIRPGDLIRWSPSCGFGPMIDGTVKRISRLKPGSVFCDGDAIEAVLGEVTLTELRDNPRGFVLDLVPDYPAGTKWAWAFQIEQPAPEVLARLEAEHETQEQLAWFESMRLTVEDVDAFAAQRAHHHDLPVALNFNEA